MNIRASGFRFQVSLRSRFALSLGAMLLPLALLAISTLFFLNYITVTLNNVVEEAMQEMQPVIHLQTLMLMTAKPPNDYLIHADPREKELFARLSGELERAFKETLSDRFALAPERNLVRAAWEEWRQARVIALSLLALPSPLGNPGTAPQMERMDTHIDRAVDRLRQVDDIVEEKAKEALAQAHAAINWAYALTASIFVAGITVAAAVVFALGRSVLIPLRALETGAKRFGAGELFRRVDLNRSDELGQLAQTFNAMAEALEKSRSTLAEHSSQLNALNQIAIAITSLLSLQDILNEIMRCGIVLTGAKASCIAFYDEATALFNQWVTQGLSEHFVGNLSFSRGGLADEAFTSGSYILSNDRPETRHKLSRLAGEEYLLCFICLPLTSRDRRLGVIYFYRTDRDTFTPTEIELLTTFASLAAQAIEKARLYAQVQEQARTDALTGLCNRGEFQRLLNEEAERSRRYHRCFSLLMLDIDHFKIVNDSYGHQAGDEVLRALAACLQKQNRPVDYAARYGGEEFVVILPETSNEGALVSAERLRAVVADTAVPVTEGRTISFTISIGVATFPVDVESGTALIAAADAALYAAKEGGRNRVVRYEPITSPPTVQG